MTEQLGDRLRLLHRLLHERGATVGTAESLTGGLLAAQLTSTPGASATVRGGLVVYASDLKVSLAGVPEQMLAAHGAVSPQTAAALAGGARTRLAVTYGLALTGVAGPDAAEGQPVGRVYAAVAGPTGTRVCELNLGGDRSAVRTSAVAAALELLMDELGRVDPGRNPSPG